MLVHVSIAVTCHVVFSRDVIIRYTPLRQNCTDAKFLLVSIRGYVLTHNVLAKSRTIFYAQYSTDRASSGPDSASDNGTDRPCGASAYFGTFLRLTERNPTGLRY